MLMTLNEEINLRDAINSFPRGTRIILYDSHSTDRTVELAKELGVVAVHTRKFDNFAAHQNWAVENIDFGEGIGKGWVYYTDADERMAPELWDQVCKAVENPGDKVAFEMRRKDYFLGTWIKHSSFYPCWFSRLFRPDKIRWERTGHVVAKIDGPVGRLSEHFIHYPFSHGMSHWFNRHIYYSEREAHDMSLELAEPVRLGNLFGNPRERRRTLKHMFYKMPFRPKIKFFVLYFLRMGFLDGRAGYHYARMQSTYEYIISLQRMEMKRREKGLPL